MDPASAIGIAASSLSLLAALGRSVISVKNMIDGIRNVNEASGHLAAELDTFQFSLSIFEHQVRTGAIRNHVAGWWDSQSLEALLTNATQTFSRLDFIYRAIRRDRSFLDRTREYLRTTMYDQEINHLKLRINTYISAFNIPVLMNIQNTRSSNRNPDQQPEEGLLLGRILQLEENTAAILAEVHGFAHGNARGQSADPQSNESIVQGSEELATIVRALASNASAITESERSSSGAGTVRRHQSGGVGYAASSESVRGVPVGPSRLYRVASWLMNQDQADPTEEPGDETDDSLSTASTQFTDDLDSTPINTPPSTISSWEDEGVETERFKRRYKKARNFIRSGTFSEAIPLLKKMMWAIERSGADVRSGPDASVYQNVQLLLATALAEDKLSAWEAKRILRELIRNPQLPDLQVFSVCYLRALLISRQQKPDWAKAQSLCLKAVNGRLSALGSHHPDSIAAVTLLSSLYSSLSSAWRAKLPTSVGGYFNIRQLTTYFRDREHGGYIDSVSFLPRSRKIVVVVSNRSVIDLWDAMKGSLDRKVVWPSGSAPIQKAHAKMIRRYGSGWGVFDILTGVDTHIADSSDIGILRVSENHTSIVGRYTGSNELIGLGWNGVTWRQNLPFSDLLTLSLDGNLLAIKNDSVIEVWRLSPNVSRCISFSCGSRGSGYGHIFSPNGSVFVFVNSAGARHVWDLATGIEILTTTTSDGPVTFSPDGTKIAYVEYEHNGVIRIIDRAMDKTSQIFGDLPVTTNGAVIWSLDGKRIAGRYFKENTIIVHFWDFDKGVASTISEPIRTRWESHQNSTVFSVDSRFFAILIPTMGIYLFDTATGKKLEKIDIDSDQTGLTFSPDGGVLAIFGQYNIKLWEITYIT